MKDKLYKNHHRGIYYRIKTGFFSFVLFAGAVALAVIPTYIIINEVAKEPTIAEPEIVEEEPDENEDNSEEETPNLLAYIEY